MRFSRSAWICRSVVWCTLGWLSACGSGPVGIRAEGSAPQYLVFRRSEPIVIDGTLADAGWSRVDATQPFVAIGGTPRARGAQARFAFDDDRLYVAVQSAEPNGERLEVRVDADRNGAPCFTGTVLPSDSSTQSGDWQRAWVANELGWSAEIAIPWRLITDAPRLPPSPGDRWQVSVTCVVPHDATPATESWVRARRDGDAGFGRLEFASRTAP